MILLHRLSAGSTLPDLIRADADIRAAASSRALPLAVRCRRSALLMGRAIAVRSCFLMAGFVLVAARMLLRAGLLGPDDAAPPLRWSSGLARTGMRLWRRGRSCRRP